jgi:hypothetical protein
MASTEGGEGDYVFLRFACVSPVAVTVILAAIVAEGDTLAEV